MSKYKPNEKFVAGPGYAVWPYLSSPDDNFPKDNPVPTYKTSLVLEDNASTSKLIAKLEAVRDAKFEEHKAELAEKVETATGAQKAKAKAALASIAKTPVFEPHYNDDGSETGKFVIKAKLKVHGSNKAGKEWVNTLPVFDCGSPPKPLVDTAIWGGSKIKISGEIVPYAMSLTGSPTVGVSLRLSAVQVIDLVTKGSGASAEAYGFGEEEGGYTATQSDDAEAFEAETDEVTEDDIDF